MSEKNIDITNYINKRVDEINKEYNNLISDNMKENAINYYIKLDKTIDEIKMDIDKSIEAIIVKYLLKLKLYKFNKSNNKTFGQTYKSSLISIFQILEENVNKKKKFEEKLNEYLSNLKIEFRKLLEERTTNNDLIENGMFEYFIGYDNLNYETIKNLYNIFINDINLVQCEAEGKVKMTTKLYSPLFDKDGKINNNLIIDETEKEKIFDFTRLKTVYDFAKKHEKKIKHHELFWHDSVPECLKNEIEEVNKLNISESEKRDLKHKMCKNFLEFYFQSLSSFFEKNKYNIEQIDVLNEIANDSLEGDFLRESFWSLNMGNEFYIEVLNLARKYFPNSKLVYNEYNEFLDYKCERICKIVKKIKEEENKTDPKKILLDGIGLQSHYMDYIKELERRLTREDIEKTALEYLKLGKEIYITEFDFNKLTNKDSNDLIDAIIEIYSVIANGFTAWGNSDILTWGHCINKETMEFLNSHIIDQNGNKKELFFKIKNNFFGLTPNVLKQMEKELNENAKKYLSIIKEEYGEYISKDLMEELQKSMLIKLESNPIEYLNNQRDSILNEPNLTEVQKEQELLNLDVPLAHGGRVFNDNVIHIYPFKLIDVKEPLTINEIKNKCDSIIIHELLHFFIRPEYITNSNANKDINDMNKYTGEALVDMCARDIQTKYHIHENDYDANYSKYVVFIREALEKITDERKKIEMIFGKPSSIKEGEWEHSKTKEIYELTSNDTYNSVKEFIDIRDEKTNFQKIITEIVDMLILDGVIDLKHKKSIESNFMNIAANCKNKEEALEKIDKLIEIEINKISDDLDDNDVKTL